MKQPEDALIWLENWYASEVDGDWEHQYGVEINTLDNPGWVVSIDLAGTSLSDKELEEVSLNRSETDWLICKRAGDKFRAHCGPKNLNEVIQIFRRWAEGS